MSKYLIAIDRGIAGCRVAVLDARGNGARSPGRDGTEIAPANWEV